MARNWLNMLGFGLAAAQGAHNDAPVSVEGLVLATASLDDLNRANIELGRQVDKLRGVRRALKVEIDKRHATRDRREN
jgi:uncharacterized protein (UPF0276 family)